MFTLTKEHLMFQIWAQKEKRWLSMEHLLFIEYGSVYYGRNLKIKLLGLICSTIKPNKKKKRSKKLHISSGSITTKVGKRTLLLPRSCTRLTSQSPWLSPQPSLPFTLPGHHCLLFLHLSPNISPSEPR